MRVYAILTALFVANAAAAAEMQPLVPIDTNAKNIVVVMPKDGSALKPTEIKTAEELTKSPLFGKDAAEKVQKEVNFETEKLVVFAWSGSGGDRIAGTLITSGKRSLVLFEYAPGLTFDLRQHFRLFVVPKDATVATRAVRAVVDQSEVKEISMQELKIAFPENPGGVQKPEIIKSVSQLSESPVLKDAAKEIKKQVNFDKEKLVFVAWVGSSADKFSIEAKRSDQKFILVFHALPGDRVDLYKHTRLFVVPKDIAVENDGGK